MSCTYAFESVSQRSKDKFADRADDFKTYLCTFLAISCSGYFFFSCGIKRQSKTDMYIYKQAREGHSFELYSHLKGSEELHVRSHHNSQSFDEVAV